MRPGARGGRARLRAPPAAAASAAAAGAPPGGFRVRRVTPQDGAAVAEMVAACFSEVSVGAQVERIQAEGPAVAGTYAEAMQRRMFDKTYEKCFNTVQNATRARQFAAAGARFRRLQEAQAREGLAGAEASLASARAAAEAGDEDPADVAARLAEADAALSAAKAASAALRPLDARAEGEEREVRMWHCLIAEARGTGEIVGTATVCWYQAGALLPPPFPTNAPAVMYVSNAAVSREFRRQGVASGVLRECEKLARRWGQSAVYLHVEDTNEGARAFYEANGYSLHGEEPAWRGAFQKRKLLLRKDLEAP